MLDWLTGHGEAKYSGFAGENKLPEAPATPGPVFAYRAFRDALLGTPAAEAEENEELTVPIKPLNPARSRPNDASPKKYDDRKVVTEKREDLFTRPDKQAPPAGSPTKSILLTPGTGVARRKTVSFGEGVVDNEQKHPTNTTSPKKGAPSGTISRQWTANLSDGMRRNRSKLTQALLDAKETKAATDDDLFDIGDRKSGREKTPSTVAQAKQITDKAIDHGPADQAADTENEDVTTNLEEPRSQSGIYWKSEFENYRAKTNQEIKKLIQYRSVAKSYAKKKEAEAIRLAEKLKREEERIDEMERHVSKLAADMTNDKGSSNESMIKELSKQTALVLQYKHKAESLRKTLEQHGVFDDDAEKNETNTDSVAQKLRDTEEALKQANARLEATERVPDMSEMQHLVATSEAKAKDLEKENLALKRNLARAKEEMSKYEERRKAKEDRLKQREQKLESRLQEYSSLLKNATNQRETAEDELKNSFAAEKKQLQETIATLKEKLGASDCAMHENASPTEGSRLSTRAKLEHNNTRPSRSTKERHDIRTAPSLLDGNEDGFDAETGDDLQLSPQHSNVHRYSNTNVATDQVSEIDFEEPLITFDGSTPKIPRARVNAYDANNNDPVPPSSPPLPDLESSIEISTRVPNHLTLAAAAVPSPRPSMIYMGDGRNARRSTDPARQAAVMSDAEDGNSGLPERRRTSRVIAKALSGINRTSRHSSFPNNGVVPPSSDSARSEAGAKLDVMPPDRLAAAKARLKQKKEDGVKAAGTDREYVA